MDSTKIVTCSAPVNIAVIKYCEFHCYSCWLVIDPPLSGGKRDEKLILPTNSSLSVCLDQDQVWGLPLVLLLVIVYCLQLKATTSVALSSSYTEDRIWINGRYLLTAPPVRVCVSNGRYLHTAPPVCVCVSNGRYLHTAPPVCVCVSNGRYLHTAPPVRVCVCTIEMML